MKVNWDYFNPHSCNSLHFFFLLDTEDASETDQQKKEDEYIEIREQ